MANTLKNSQIVANELLESFINSSGLARMVDHQFEKKFGKAGAKIGSAIEVRDTVLMESGTGQGISPQDVEEKTKFLRLNQHYHVAWKYSVEEDSLNVDQWMERHGRPAIIKLANRWDTYLCRLAAESAVAGFVGTPATAVTAMKQFGQARALVQKQGAPPTEGMIMVMAPDTQVEAIALAQGLFTSQPQIRKQYEDGNMGRANGFNWHMSQNIRRHTVGPLGGTPLVDGAQTGASILTNGWTASAANRLKKGDTITFGVLGTATEVRGVDQITKEELPDLKVYTVTADADSDAAGVLTIQIDPPVITAGAYQNSSNSIPNDAEVQIFAHASSHADTVSAMNM